MITLNLCKDCVKLLRVNNPYKTLSVKIRRVPKELCDNREDIRENFKKEYIGMEDLFNDN